MLKFFKNKSGFTLIETVVALGVIMTGVMASLTLITSVLTRSKQSEQDVVAVNLAREGIEIIRSIRNDENPFDPGDINIFDGSYDNASFMVDAAVNFNLSQRLDSSFAYPADLKDCADCQLYLDGNRYVHNGVDATFFKRRVTILDISDSEKNIVSEVSWLYGGQVHYFILETHLTDWLNAIKFFN